MHAPDLTGMGHRSAGIDAAIKGMWYVVGPRLGLQGLPSQFDRTSQFDMTSQFDKSRWNREQHWMADTSRLMQMIDDWVDQDSDRGRRLTPVVNGDWTLKSVAELFGKTAQDLTAMLAGAGIQNPVLQALFADLYKDYLHTALEGMRSGLAA